MKNNLAKLIVVLAIGAFDISIILANNSLCVNGFMLLLLVILAGIMFLPK